MSFPGPGAPKNFLRDFFLPAFIGGFGGGFVALVINSKSIFLLLLLGALGGGIALGIKASFVADEPISVPSFVTIALTLGIGMSYISLIGALFAFVLLR